MIEEQRLSFIEQANGNDEARNFAQRAMRLYRTAVLRSRKRGFKHPHHASLPEYRRSFIESYCAFKRYLTEGVK